MKAFILGYYYPGYGYSNRDLDNVIWLLFSMSEFKINSICTKRQPILNDLKQPLSTSV